MLQKEETIRDDEDDEEGALPPEVVAEEEEQNEEEDFSDQDNDAPETPPHSPQPAPPLETVPEPPPPDGVLPTISCDSHGTLLALQSLLSHLAAPADRDAYHAMALRNAFATLSEYAGNLGMDGRTFLKQMFAEFALPPQLSASLASAQVVLARPRPILNIPAPPERTNKRRRMSPPPAEIPTTVDLDPSLLGFHLHEPRGGGDNLSDLTQSEEQSSSSASSSVNQQSEEELTDVEDATPPPAPSSAVRPSFRPPPPPPPDEEESLKLPLWNTGLPRRLFSQ